MGHSKKVVALLALVPLALGCTGLRWSLQKSLRSAGTVNQAFPEVVWRDHDCGDKPLPFLAIEHSELIPPKVAPGGEFNHRMVYALCPQRPTQVVQGRLVTRILFRGLPLHTETEPDYEILPGRWRVDAFVELPVEAEPGVYAYQLEFEGDGLSFEKTLTFLVR